MILSKCSPKQDLFPKQPTFPKQPFTPGFSFILSNLGSSVCEACTSFHIQLSTALNLRTTMSISIFCSGVEETTKDFPTGYPISLSQENTTCGKGQGPWFWLHSAERCHFAMTSLCFSAACPYPLPISSPLPVLKSLFCPPLTAS